jgi:ActR/RegA family two-component response regulator
VIAPHERRVLLACGDAPLRALVVESLDERGLQVDECGFEEDLLRRALRARQERDLLALVVDLGLSRSGIPLIEAVRALLPDVPLYVLCSYPSSFERSRLTALDAEVIDAPHDLGRLGDDLSPRRSA